MALFIRFLTVIFFVYLTLMALMATQAMFDRGDLRKAVAAVRDHPVAQAPYQKLGEAMAVSLGLASADLPCVADLLSRYEGVVRVTCGSDKLQWIWQVDVVRGTVMPLGDQASKLLKGIEEHK